MTGPKRPDLPGDLTDLPIDAPREVGEETPRGTTLPLFDGESLPEDPVSEPPGPTAPPQSEPDEAEALEQASSTEADETSEASENDEANSAQVADDAPSPAPSALSGAPDSASASPTPVALKRGIFDKLPDPSVGSQQGSLELEDDAAMEGLDLSEDLLEEEESAYPAGFLVRLQSGCADLLAHLAVVSAALVAMKLMDLQPALDQWPGFVAFLAIFSFLYLAFPLAFWGHTPGMAWFGLVARDEGDRPLAFGQTGVRVVASWATVLLIGLPLLASLTGRSLVDRLSRSETWLVR